GLGDPGAGARAGAGRDRGGSAETLRRCAQRRRNGRSTRAEIHRAARGDFDRRDRNAAGPRRQGLFDGGAREDDMSELADHKPTETEGFSVLERQKSVAETHGIPVAVLLELTHRCPLQCPYCSNPLELDRGSTELTTDEWKKVL